MNSHLNAALVIVGHGSTVNPDSSTPTHRHADTIRQRGVFREVTCCFWKEEPSMREVYEAVESEVIYIVPNFISEGYFCQQVLPRELLLDGPVTRRDGRLIHYCDPVGIHPNMTRLLLQRADEVAPGVPRGETSLVIVGHGTNLNENSVKAIQDQVHIIRNGGYGFAEVIDAYMEEAPFVADWHRLATASNVVVVPFFIADGLHSYQDIPVLLGIAEEPGKALSESDVFRHNPIEMHGHHLYYSGAIGTESLMADVILDQVVDFDRKHGITSSAGAPEPVLRQALASWLAAGRKVIGQVQINTLASGGYSLCHVEDHAAEAAGELAVQTEPIAALEIATRTSDGAFRPLKTAPNLKRGWRLDLSDLAAVHLALDFFYPAAIGKLHALEAGTLRPVPLRELLGRQTGMYRFANQISDEQADAMIGTCCDTRTKCLRRIVWGLNEDRSMSGPAAAKLGADAGGMPGHQTDGIPLVCMEACPLIVSAARTIARKNQDALRSPGGDTAASPGA